MGRPLTPEAEAEALEGSLVAEDSEGLLAVDMKAGLTLWDEGPILGLKGTLAWFVFSADFGFEGPSRKERRLEGYWYALSEGLPHSAS